ncbi:MAG: NAD-binding protein [Promethearchaeota archaeon]
MTLDLLLSIKYLFYLDRLDTEFGRFYATFSEFIIFGLIFSSITVELFRKYNPAMTSREISKKIEDHVVIIGYNHIGQRIREYFQNKGIDVVVIDKDENKVHDLIEKEEPVVLDDALTIETLYEASVDKARAIYVMSDDLELQLVVNAYIRDINKNCIIIDRIFEDDIGELIKTTYNTKIISTSRFASKVIFRKIHTGKKKNILIIGANHISARLIKRFLEIPDIKYQIIEENEELIEEMMFIGKPIIIGDPKDDLVLEKANIKSIDCVVNTIPNVTQSILITKHIRELNHTCKIISRIFLDSVAGILEKSPFRSEVISSSKSTLDVMIQKGYMNV